VAPIDSADEKIRKVDAMLVLTQRRPSFLMVLDRKLRRAENLSSASATLSRSYPAGEGTRR
jgi:hypothetical protein